MVKKGEAGDYTDLLVKGQHLNSSLASKDTEMALKRRKAVALRVAGATYEQISEKLGFAHRSSAYRLVKEAMDETKEATEIETSHLRDLEIMRMEAIKLELWRMIMDKSGKFSVNQKLRAVDRYTSVSARLAKLAGLDQPHGVLFGEDPNNPFGGDEDAAKQKLLARLKSIVEDRQKEIVEGEIVEDDDDDDMDALPPGREVGS